MFTPKFDAAFREYADLELRCHILLSNGKDGSPEMEEAEARMEELWPQLDDVQQRSLRGMSSDLTWIRAQGKPFPKGRKKPEEVPSTDLQELSAAMKARDHHRVLHYLRLCTPCFPSESLARERAGLYAAIGLPEYARVFESSAIQFHGNHGVVGEGQLFSPLETTR